MNSAYRVSQRRSTSNNKPSDPTIWICTLSIASHLTAHLIIKIDDIIYATLPSPVSSAAVAEGDSDTVTILYSLPESGISSNLTPARYRSSGLLSVFR